MDRWEFRRKLEGWMKGWNNGWGQQHGGEVSTDGRAYLGMGGRDR